MHALKPKQLNRLIVSLLSYVNKSSEVYLYNVRKSTFQSKSDKL